MALQHHHHFAILYTALAVLAIIVGLDWWASTEIPTPKPYIEPVYPKSHSELVQDAMTACMKLGGTPDLTAQEGVSCSFPPQAPPTVIHEYEGYARTLMPYPYGYASTSTVP